MPTINVTWEQPIELNTSPSNNLTIDFHGEADRKEITTGRGVYVFAKIHGDNVRPLYVGSSKNIRRRIPQHFKHHVPLMNKIKRSGPGRKVLIVGSIPPSPGPDNHAHKIVEKALIKKLAIDDDIDLFNLSGTRVPFDNIKFRGYLGARNMSGTNIKNFR